MHPSPIMTTIRTISIQGHANRGGAIVGPVDVAIIGVATVLRGSVGIKSTLLLKIEWVAVPKEYLAPEK